MWNHYPIIVNQTICQDPFLDFSIWNCPIDEGNVKQFIEGPLDIVIDECDSIFTKILLRKEAKFKRIPVVMHTSDRGMLDIELYNDRNFDFSWTLSRYSHLSKEEILEKAKLIIADYCDFNGANVASAVRAIFLGDKVAGGRYLLDPTLKFKNQISGE